jgi:imidazolonepropionase-like amidohydrolase
MKTLIRTGQLIDGTGAEPQNNMDLLIEDNRIAAIIPRSDIVPEDTLVIDASQQTVLPGLIDAHVHICSDPVADPVYLEMTDSPAMHTIRGVRNARLTLESGVTAIRTLGTPHNADLYIRDAINSGIIPGPRIVAGGRTITITGGHGYYYRMEADGVDEMRKAVRTLVKEGVDIIKLTVTGGVMTPGIMPGVPKFNREEVAAVVEEAHKAGIKVTGHAEGKQGVNDAMLAGIDCLEHGYFMNNEEGLTLLVEKGVYLVPTIMAYDLIATGEDRGVPPATAAKSQMAVEYNTVGFRNAVNAGAKIAMGSDAGTAFNDHNLTWRELVHMVKHGMTPMQAIVAATRNGADLLGWIDRIGTLEPGKLADVIVVDGDPLADIAEIGNVTHVFKDGKLIRGPQQ